MVCVTNLVSEKDKQMIKKTCTSILRCQEMGTRRNEGG
jgi:hypothetical protein